MLPGEMRKEAHSSLGRVIRYLEDRMVVGMGTVERRLAAMFEIS
jgi:hypothetical protein